MKITDIFKQKERSYSFEFFPPKDEISAVEFGINAGQIMKLSPSFISVTYGAGGSTQAKTFSLVDFFQNKLGLTCMAHYTCVHTTREKVHSDLQYLKNINIENLMLLRGDAPKELPVGTNFTKDFSHASDLIAYARKHFSFSIGAAAYPEKHIEAVHNGNPLSHEDIKIQAGADFLITQMFFDNSYYFSFVEKVRKAGIKNRIIPGIMPIINFKQIQKFAEISNAHIPEEITTAFLPYKDDEKKAYQLGVDLAVKQCVGLLEKGAPGIHFYTLNKSRAVVEIFESLIKKYPE